MPPLRAAPSPLNDADRTGQAPYAGQVHMQSEETRNHLFKRLAYVLTLTTVMLDAGSIMCPVMAVKNPYLTSNWPMEGLTLAAATYFTLEELGVGSKLITA